MAFIRFTGNSKFNPQPKPEAVLKNKSVLKKEKKPTGEKAVFQNIWDKRPHKSQISGERISEAKAINFLHVLAKGQNKFPLFKLEEENIVLGTEEEHFIWDNARHLIPPNHKGWKKLLEKESLLKEKYRLLLQVSEGKKI